MTEDFGGADVDPRAKAREQKVARGECRECDQPVMIKRNGRPAKLCADHAERDRKRKAAP